MHNVFYKPCTKRLTVTCQMYIEKYVLNKRTLDQPCKYCRFFSTYHYYCPCSPFSLASLSRRRYYRTKRNHVFIVSAGTSDKLSLFTHSADLTLKNCDIIQTINMLILYVKWERGANFSMQRARASWNLFRERGERVGTDRSVSVSNVDVQTKRCVPNLLLGRAFRWQARDLGDRSWGTATTVYVHDGRGGGVAEHGKCVQAVPFHRRAAIVGVRNAGLSGVVGQYDIRLPVYTGAWKVLYLLAPYLSNASVPSRTFARVTLSFYPRCGYFEVMFRLHHVWDRTTDRDDNEHRSFLFHIIDHTYRPMENIERRVLSSSFCLQHSCF